MKIEPQAHPTMLSRKNSTFSYEFDKFYCQNLVARLLKSKWIQKYNKLTYVIKQQIAPKKKKPIGDYEHNWNKQVRNSKTRTLDLEEEGDTWLRRSPVMAPGGGGGTRREEAGEAWDGLDFELVYRSGIKCFWFAIFESFYILITNMGACG